MNSRLTKYIIYFMYFMIAVLVFLAILVIYDGVFRSVKNGVVQENNNKEVIKKEKAIPVDQIIMVTGSVPFVAQAPFGNWGDIIYEEGCEEASILMAVNWSRGLDLNPEIANVEIKKISDKETELLGNFLDTSIYDTAKILKEYFSFDDYEIKENILKNDIIESINDGKIVLIPAYGRDLKNPHYNLPGPIAHMLLIYGYDPKLKEFITNDPGTKNGKGFRYDEDILYNAIWAYPSSANTLLPPEVNEKREKIVIIVNRE